MHSLTRRDYLVCLGILLFAVLIHFGRAGASIDGVHLRTDPAMYASIAAAYGHPGDFVRDFVYSDPANFSTHVTPLVRLVNLLATDGNYGLAYLSLTGPVVFLHCLAFFLLGRMLFQSTLRGVIFCVLMGLCYWTPWGTYWGGGYEDYTPRTIFDAFYALFLCAALAILKKPRLWPVFMLLFGGLVHVHSVSALPAAAGIWLSFAVSREEGVSWTRHGLRLCLAGLCFLAAMAPYALVYLHTSAASLTADEVGFMDHVLRTRFDIEYAEYWDGMKRFYRQYTLLSVIPLALLSTWLVARRGDLRERRLVRHIWLWIAGVYVVIALFLLDQAVASALGRMHIEFDLVRVHRFLPFFCMCLIFIAASMLWNRAAGSGWRERAVRLLCVGTVIGFFLGGQNEMARTSLAWYWNRLDDARYEAAYGKDLRRAEMIDALKRLTPEGGTIFFAGEDQAIRYNAMRPMSWCWKDACLLYYAKAIPTLRDWIRIEEGLGASPTAYVALALSLSPDYVLSERKEDRALLEREVGPVLWENARYLLVRNTRAGSSAR